jgi:hypothetical protein
MMVPDRWTARRSGASLLKTKKLLTEAEFRDVAQKVVGQSVAA